MLYIVVETYRNHDPIPVLTSAQAQAAVAPRL
jgi:hypothetical protein